MRQTWREGEDADYEIKKSSRKRWGFTRRYGVDGSSAAGRVK